MNVSQDDVFISACSEALERYDPSPEALSRLVRSLRREKRFRLTARRAARMNKPPSNAKPKTRCRYYAALTPNLLSMPYREYLQTDYWKAVRVLKLDNSLMRCERCGKDSRLQIHHKTYRHLGEEYEFLGDVCHKIEHGIRIEAA